MTLESMVDYYGMPYIIQCMSRHFAAGALASMSGFTLTLALLWNTPVSYRDIKLIGVALGITLAISTHTYIDYAPMHWPLAGWA